MTNATVRFVAGGADGDSERWEVEMPPGLLATRRQGTIYVWTCHSYAEDGTVLGFMTPASRFRLVRWLHKRRALGTARALVRLAARVGVGAPRT